MQHNGGVHCMDVQFWVIYNSINSSESHPVFQSRRDCYKSKHCSGAVIYHNWLVLLQTEDLQQFVIQSSSLLNLSSRMYQPFTNLDVANRNFAVRRVKATLDWEKTTKQDTFRASGE